MRRRRMATMRWSGLGGEGFKNPNSFISYFFPSSSLLSQGF